jgi:NAD(P)-dependent dehydrogenase (short-subunit alcohol dehydrogenase family)
MTISSGGGRIVAVTGGANGIGAACVRVFAARGDSVFILDRDAGAARQLMEECPGSRFIAIDVADSRSVTAAFAEIDSISGQLDVLVNSAGIESKSLLTSVSEENWDRVLDVNLKGTMLCTQAAARMMKRARSGSVVNVASVAGKRISFSGDVAYTASKGGVLGFTRHAAFELAADQIRVNAVCPGPTLTPMILRNLSQERMDAVVQAVPLGRWVQPSDVANMIEFLAGDGAAMCTGYQDYFAART